MNNDLERTLVDICNERQLNLPRRRAKDLSGIEDFVNLDAVNLFLYHCKEPGAHTPGLRRTKNRKLSTGEFAPFTVQISDDQIASVSA